MTGLEAKWPRMMMTIATEMRAKKYQIKSKASNTKYRYEVSVCLGSLGDGLMFLHLPDPLDKVLPMLP